MQCDTQFAAGRRSLASSFEIGSGNSVMQHHTGEASQRTAGECNPERGFRRRRLPQWLATRRVYRSRKTIRPLVRSYGDNSTRTLSPGTMRIKFFLIRPATCAKTSVPVSNCTRKRVFAKAAVTVPSTSNASSFFPINSAAEPAFTCENVLPKRFLL